MPTILIVDDDATFLRQLQSSLADLAEVRVARQAADVIRLCRQQTPDLLLLDLRLDDGDGIALLEQIRSERSLSVIPVMFLTGEDDAILRARAYDLDVVDWLSKPVDEARLRARVQAALRRARPGINDAGVGMPEAHSPALVLAVDDDPIILDALRSTLASEEIRLHTALNAQQALDIAAAGAPDLVMLDIGLRAVNGFQLADRLLELPSIVDVPIIFVTQYGDVESEIRALGMGAFDFVSKPFLPAVLRARVRNALRHRRRAQATLDRAQARWQRITSAQVAAIVDQAQDAIVSFNEDGRLVLANRAAQRLLGVSGEPLVGLALPGWLQAGLPDELLKGRQAQAEHVRLEPPGRDVLICDVSAQADAWSGPRLVTLILKDQTLRLRAESEERARLRAQAESRTKQLMMSYLAHEIGNPLNGVVNLTALMLAPGADPLTAEQSLRLGLVQQSADVLRHLMADALDLARWEAGQFSLRLLPAAVAPAVSYCIDTLTPAARAAGIHIAGPSGDLGARAMVDDMRLRQCLHNLVSNACKYGKSGGSIRIDVLEGENEVTISVMDDGPGVAPEQMARLFEPFDRLGRHGSAGHGLGLAVTRMLMQAMGGRIDVASTEGVGSRFSLVLRKPGAGTGSAR